MGLAGRLQMLFILFFNKLHHTCATTAPTAGSGLTCQMKGHYAIQPAAYIVPDVNLPLDGAA